MHPNCFKYLNEKTVILKIQNTRATHFVMKYLHSYQLPLVYNCFHSTFHELQPSL